MKAFYLLMFALAFQPVISRASTCDQEILKIFLLDNQQLNACVIADAGFQDALKGLCTSDKKNLSEVYLEYRNYEIPYNEQLKAYRSANDQTEALAARLAMQMIEQEWIVRGHKLENEPAKSLGMVYSAMFRCGRQN